ncbi:MAG: YgjP-like metallopeptidase domain-containing protein [Jatrophihabitans sp.]
MSTPVDEPVYNPLDLWTASAPVGVGPALSFGLVSVGAVVTSGLERSAGGAPVEVRRSAKRRRTVSAYRDGTRIVVLIPARFTAAQEHEWVAKMVARVEGTGTRRRDGDAALARRATELSGRYLAGRAVPTSVCWVPPMRTRWASCTPADGTIRLSQRLAQLPGWVQDYVLVHELAHLLEPGHGTVFWGLVDNYPRTERARGYLDGVSAAANLPIADDLADDTEPEPASDTGAEVAE